MCSGFVFIINVLYTFTSLFGFIYVMTAGGPGYDTTTIDFLVYLRAFSSSNLGSGAALAVILFLFIGILTLIQNRVFRLQEKTDERRRQLATSRAAAASGRSSSRSSSWRRRSSIRWYFVLMHVAASERGLPRRPVRPARQPGRSRTT